MKGVNVMHPLIAYPLHTIERKKRKEKKKKNNFNQPYR